MPGTIDLGRIIGTTILVGGSQSFEEVTTTDMSRDTSTEIGDLRKDITAEMIVTVTGTTGTMAETTVITVGMTDTTVDQRGRAECSGEVEWTTM
jgi:hypothetical protein